MKISRLVISILIWTCLVYFHIHAERKSIRREKNKQTNEQHSSFLTEIFFMDNGINSTTIDSNNSIPIWFHRQFLICIISVSLGTILVLFTFLVPVAIIIRRIRRERPRLDFKALRRISDFL